MAERDVCPRCSGRGDDTAGDACSLCRGAGVVPGDDAGTLSPAQAAYLEGSTVVEVARQFVDPQHPDDLLPIPWNQRHRGAPDLTTPPPRINGHEMRWVRRTVVYGPWEEL